MGRAKGSQIVLCASVRCHTSDDPGRVPRNYGVVRDLEIDHGRCADDRADSDHRTSQEDGADTDPRIRFENDRGALVIGFIGGRIVRARRRPPRCVADDDLVADEAVVTDADTSIGGEDGSNNGAVVADLDLSLGSEIEEGPDIDARVSTDRDPDRRFAPVVEESETAVEPAAGGNSHIVWKIGREPVVGQARHAHASLLATAGLP